MNVTEIRIILDAFEQSRDEIIKRKLKTIIRGLIGENESKERKEMDLFEKVKLVYEESGKIPAIKEYRSHTGASLINAKNWIESKAELNNWVAPRFL